MKTDLPHCGSLHKALFRAFMLAVLMCLPAIAYGQYALYNFSGNVKVVRSGKTLAATKGMKLLVPDYVEIPSGGWAEVSSTIGGKTEIYRQNEAGTFKVPAILDAAKRSANDQSAALWSSMSLTKKGKGGNSLVYDESGMVTRALGRVGEGAPGVDSLSLASAVCAVLRGSSPAESLLPYSTISKSVTKDVASMLATNSADYTVWVNVLCISSDEDGEPTVEISTLGQLGANFMLLPGQSMARRQPMPLSTEGERHIAVAAAADFDTEALLRDVLDRLRVPDATEAQGVTLTPAPIHAAALIIE